MKKILFLLSTLMFLSSITAYLIKGINLKLLFFCFIFFGSGIYISMAEQHDVFSMAAKLKICSTNTYVFKAFSVLIGVGCLLLLLDKSSIDLCEDNPLDYWLLKISCGLGFIFFGCFGLVSLIIEIIKRRGSSDNGK